MMQDDLMLLPMVALRGLVKALKIKQPVPSKYRGWYLLTYLGNVAQVSISGETDNPVYRAYGKSNKLLGEFVTYGAEDNQWNDEDEEQ